MDNRIAFATHGFAVVVCKHPDGRFLAVNETNARGWWLPAGHVDAGQSFVEAAIRETEEEAGISVDLKGILAVEHSICSRSSARMRVIFYAEPRDPTIPIKSIPEKESEGAAWMRIEEIEELSTKAPPEGLRGEELLRWGTYINKGGLIAPLIVEQHRSTIHYSGFFRMEDEGPQTTVTPLAAPVAFEMSSLLPIPPGSASGGALRLTNEDAAPVLTAIQLAKQWTALHAAVCNDNLELTRRLLLSGANASAVTHKGRTPLHCAANRGNVAIFRLLLLSGSCDPSIRDCDGKAAEDMILGSDGMPDDDTERCMKALLKLI